jgi:HD-like signal output (HDOD) protein
LRLLGLKSVRSSIVTATIQSLVVDDNPISKQILEHMLGISTLCKLIARSCCSDATDDLEFLGLVHDLGMLTLAANLKQAYTDVVIQAQQSGQALDVAEREAFGISHNVVSARVAVDFRLPKPHIELLQSFHQPQAKQDRAADTQQRDACILSLAHHLFEQLNPQANGILETVVESADDAKRALGLSEEQISRLCDEFNALASVSD